MNAHALLASFAADWPRLSAVLDPAAQRELHDVLAAWRAAGSGTRLAERAVRVVLEALPAPEGARFTGPAATVPYDGYGALDLCLLVVDGNPMVGPLLGPVRRRLLAAPMRDDAPGARGRRGLIVLRDERGQRAVPAFQFGGGGAPWPVVTEVNALLGADDDPWGTADWWLSPHTWWGCPPAALLGQGRDAELVAAARDLTTPDGG
ncbi:hypothetical protein GCM10010218_32930 [Streptomyces mashuensis]|uniref:Uncharacterized protein n=1 Tax=Streptomyces mashuensis TaxID=33904 RepID=A0A919EDG8_9ACTN|nr:hypothetical protein [Streptomyces mashuensis]GHF48854.1 hypothetical protein GCM10010218_32930 [Streptomyces mashuensis]